LVENETEKKKKKWKKRRKTSRAQEEKYFMGEKPLHRSPSLVSIFTSVSIQTILKKQILKAFLSELRSKKNFISTQYVENEINVVEEKCSGKHNPKVVNLAEQGQRRSKLILE
jgi:hypothetical protein